MPVVVASVANLVQALRQHRLLEPERLNQLAPWAAKFSEPKALAKDLVQRGWLTPFQVNQLMQGKGADLGLGNYVLIERLGEGGMGQVFKACHRAMGRVVALKVMRKELTSRPDTVRRFRREIMAAASLHHPNIVLAFDADQVGDLHFFVMEYIEGIDLGRLVKTRGPLPVRDACDAIRQAAMGLQHAFEHNLVHRDIKPTNLFRAQPQGSQPGGVIKLLDMGLARLRESESDSSSNVGGGPLVSVGTQLTQAGKVMGTPDFIAPEQARNSHTVDIRGDLYSLGCTFYFLLTGRVPFPGGTLLEKLFKHQTEMPQPVEQLRPEVSPPIAGIIRKLMAKRPEDRFQTPSELAAALVGLTIPAHLQQAAAQTMVGRRVLASPDYPVPTATPVIASAVLDGPGADSPEEIADPIPLAFLGRRSHWGGWVLFAGVGGALLLFSFGLALLSSSNSPSHKAAVTTSPVKKTTPKNRPPRTSPRRGP